MEKPMDEEEVARLWDENADDWTELSRMGYDICRDYLNTPAFLGMLPDVCGLSGVDIGCGEGHNTRLVARLGARMMAVDISRKFVGHARVSEESEPMGIRYMVASASSLPFPGDSFDFAVAFMSLMDALDHPGAISEAFRVIRPGGFFQFSITHPFTDVPGRKWVDDEAGRHIAMQTSGYFQEGYIRVDEWIFGAAPEELTRNRRRFRIPVFRRTMSGWLNLLVEKGFRIERVAEPVADEETLKACPRLYDSRIAPFFLLILCRKPA